MIDEKERKKLEVSFRKELQVFVIIMAIGLILFLFFMMITGCTPEIVKVNNTIKEIRIINNTVECQDCAVPECVCKCEPQKEKECFCDNSKEKKCQLQVGRLVAEVDHLKNMSNRYLVNKTIEEYELNISNCEKERDEALDKIKEIEDSLK